MAKKKKHRKGLPAKGGSKSGSKRPANARASTSPGAPADDDDEDDDRVAADSVSHSNRKRADSQAGDDADSSRDDSRRRADTNGDANRKRADSQADANHSKRGKRGKQQRAREDKPATDERDRERDARRERKRLRDRDDSQLPKATVARVKAQPVRGPQQPAFWFGFEVSWAKLAIARVVIFGLLAIDAILQISHAPRYGAGDFNVGNLPVFGAIAPGRVGYEVGQLASAYAFVFAMFGIATRWVVPIGAALYAWMYFGSQLDSYQHHYLVALVLAMASFVPWQRPDDAAPDTPVRSWALRLVLVQLGIMYFWAAISKMDHYWIDGTTLGKQMSGSMRAFVDRTIGIQQASFVVIVVELFLAAAVWNKRLWKYAAPVGLLFHVGIASTGLEIGLFAYLMLGFYILIVPDAIWIAIAESSFGTLLRDALAKIGNVRNAAVLLAGALAGVALLVLTRLELTFVIGTIGTAIVVGAIAFALVKRQRAAPATLAVAHLVTLFLFVAVDRLGDVATDYYRFWGGSQRRLGNLDTAERAYGRLAAIASDEPNGHYQLGRLLLDDRVAKPRPETDAAKAARHAAGLAAVRRAQELEPGRARAILVEARHLAARGRTADAIATARRAVAAEPSNRDARQLLKDLLESKTATPDTDASP